MLMDIPILLDTCCLAIIGHACSVERINKNHDLIHEKVRAALQ